MEPRITLVTLGVSDLARSIRFYRDGSGSAARDAGKRRVLRDAGMWLSLYAREALAEDATVSPEGSGFRGFTLAHNVRSPEAVDLLLADARRCGRHAGEARTEVFWGGYSGYFADPDGFCGKSPGIRTSRSSERIASRPPLVLHVRLALGRRTDPKRTTLSPALS